MYYVSAKNIADSLELVSTIDGSGVASVQGNANGYAVVQTVEGRYVVDAESRKVWRLLDWRLGTWEELI